MVHGLQGGMKNGRTRRRGQSNREKSKTRNLSLPILYGRKKLTMYFTDHKMRQAAHHGLFV
jgi:hypothetical protein